MHAFCDGTPMNCTSSKKSIIICSIISHKIWKLDNLSTYLNWEIESGQWIPAALDPDPSAFPQMSETEWLSVSRNCKKIDSGLDHREESSKVSSHALHLLPNVERILSSLPQRICTKKRMGNQTNPTKWSISCFLN